MSSTKSRKFNSFFKNIRLAEEFLSTNPQRLSEFNENKTPVSFIAIDSIRLDSTRKIEGASKLRNNEREEGNNSYLRKSKYSPFKSRNGSSASNGGPTENGGKVKSFEGVDEKRLRSTTSFNHPNKFRLGKHKRMKT